MHIRVVAVARHANGEILALYALLASRPRSIAHDHALRLARVLGHGRALEQHGQAVVVLELVDLRKQLEIHVGGVVVPMS